MKSYFIAAALFAGSSLAWIPECAVSHVCEPENDSQSSVFPQMTNTVKDLLPFAFAFAVLLPLQLTNFLPVERLHVQRRPWRLRPIHRLGMSLQQPDPNLTTQHLRLNIMHE
jgi:hypothetical protein